MSRVGLRKCETYDLNDLNEALLDLMYAFDKDTLKNKSILIVFDFPMPDINLLKAITNILKNFGAGKISFGASIFSEPLPTEFIDFIEREKIEFINFRSSNYEKISVPFRKYKRREHFIGYNILSPGNVAQEKLLEQSESSKTRVLKNAYLPVSITDTDLVIPILKMKDSAVLKIGGFVNATLSFVPTITRSEILMHLLDYKFYDSMLEIFSLFKEKVPFGIVDGVKTELSYDSELNKIGVLLFSEDLLSLDGVIAVLIGFNTSEIETNKIGDLFGMGDGILTKITLFGDNFLDFKRNIINNLRYSNTIKKKKTAPRIARQDIEILESIITYCPTGAIEEKEKNHFEIEKSKCIKCNFCIEISKGSITI